MEYQTIIYEVRNQIAFVTFNRPESMNAVNRQMARDLVDACKQIEDDNGIRIAIFTGAGEKAFSAGMDLKERAESGSSPIERRQQKLSATIHTQSRAVAAITKPTIAAIRGYCVGGGLEFALACDMRVAAEDAKLGLAEVKRGSYSWRRRHAKTGAYGGRREGVGNLSHRRQRQRQRSAAFGSGQYRCARKRRHESRGGFGGENSQRRPDVGIVY